MSRPIKIYGVTQLKCNRARHGHNFGATRVGYILHRAFVREEAYSSSVRSSLSRTRHKNLILESSGRRKKKRTKLFHLVDQMTLDNERRTHKCDKYNGINRLTRKTENCYPMVIFHPSRKLTVTK